MDTKVSERIKVLGFLMTCEMAVYHVGSPGNPINAFDGKWNTFIGSVFDTLAVLVMSYFFTVTGYLLFRNLNFTNYVIKIKKRLYSLLLPYCAWQCVIMLKEIIFRGGANHISKYLSCMFLFQKWPPNGALWYLYAVFVLALFSPIFLIIFKNRKIGLVVCLIILVALNHLGFSSNSMIVAFRSYGYIGNIFSYFPSYVVGAYCGMHSEELSAEEQLRNVLAVVFVALVFDGLYSGFLYGIIIRMLPMFLLYLFPVPSCMSDRSIYKLTFLIYAVHMPIISDIAIPVRNFISQITPYAYISNLGTRMICLSIDCILAAILYTGLKRFSPKMLGVLTGGRT